tara:strand:+ start:73718 stop:75577 length:1860 start_codon:yes stop_codon:yes gene_type:complete
MKKILILFAFLLSINSFSQELSTKYKEYSYAQLFKMIGNEKDTIFKLKDAIIRYNVKTDSVLTTGKYSFMEISLLNPKQEKIVIDKQIVFNNVHFGRKKQTILDLDNPTTSMYFAGYLLNIHFKKKVHFINVKGLEIYHCIFEERFRMSNDDIVGFNDQFIKDKKIDPQNTVGHNMFKKHLTINVRGNKEKLRWDRLHFFKNTVHTNYLEKLGLKNVFNQLIISDITGSIILNNTFLGNGFTMLKLSKIDNISITDNTFMSPRSSIDLSGAHEKFVVKNNTLTKGLQLAINDLKASDLIEWKQFNDKIYSENAFINYTELLPDEEYNKIDTDSFRTLYREKLRFQNSEIYAGEAAMRGVLYRHYRDNFDMVSANKVYMNLKDFETMHLKYQFEIDPSFDTYFQWKVNQFLKVFSNYGTKPSKAITFSVYVIFVFALFYLFFPNSWDRHGKNRILDRYSFFLKYMDKKAGIHEVYLEGQKEEILAYDEYKKLIEKSDKKVPRFFTATVLPIYKWSVAGTQLSMSFLRKIDIMKGTWSDLPKSKRIWKSTLLISAFLIAVLYDVFIKMLNALMLSINTFTTLGFGEIPIKGLPRYLAIVQGFIGWFMLTIFSVSLISQLLN